MLSSTALVKTRSSLQRLFGLPPRGDIREDSQDARNISLFVSDGGLQGANDRFLPGWCCIAFFDFRGLARDHNPPIVGTVFVCQLLILGVKVVIGLADHLFGCHPEIAGKVLIARQIDGISVLMNYLLGKVIEESPIPEVMFLQGRPAFNELVLQFNHLLPKLFHGFGLVGHRRHLRSFGHPGAILSPPV